MREAVIASTARTGIGRAFKGALNHTKSPTLLGHVLKHAVERARIDPARIIATGTPKRGHPLVKKLIADDTVDGELCATDHLSALHDQIHEKLMAHVRMPNAEVSDGAGKK